MASYENYGDGDWHDYDDMYYHSSSYHDENWKNDSQTWPSGLESFICGFIASLLIWYIIYKLIPRKNASYSFWFTYILIISSSNFILHYE